MNVTALTDKNGDEVERYVYDPYGNCTVYNNDWSQTVSWPDSKKNNIRFSGYYFDNETGLYSVRNRVYHDRLGWLQRDPIGYADGMSLYEYVGSNPAGLRDAMGLCTEPTQEELWGDEGDGSATDRDRAKENEDWERKQARLARERGRVARVVGGGGGDDDELDWWELYATASGGTEPVEDEEQKPKYPKGDAGYAYGETGSLRPAWKDPEGPQKFENYDPKSAEALRNARQAICEVAEHCIDAGRPRRQWPHHAAPSEEELKNENTKYAWDMCKEAAGRMAETRITGPEAQHMYIRVGNKKLPDGTFKSKPRWARGMKPSHSFGVFRKLGTSGDVPPTNEAYVDIYSGVK